MIISTQGVVTKAINIGDNNKLITILTKDMGVIYAFINGCKKINSKLLASTEILSYCEFILFKNKEKYTVNEVQLLKQFPNIRTDVEKLALACYIIQLANELAAEGQISNEYLRLVLNSLYVLDGGKKNIWFVKSIVEFKMVSISGYMPDLICCYKCLLDKPDGKYWFCNSGKLICQKCFNNSAEEKVISLTSGVLQAMRHIIYSDISKIYSFQLSDDDMLILNNVTQNYLLAKTDLNLSTLKYLTDIISKNEK